MANNFDGSYQPSFREASNFNGIAEHVAALDERSKTFATREDLLVLKNEIIAEVRAITDKCYDSTSSVTYWAIGTVSLACLTLTVSIGLAVYNATSSNTNLQKTNSVQQVAQIQPTTPAPQRVEIAITVNGEKVSTGVRK